MLHKIQFYLSRCWGRRARRWRGWSLDRFFEENRCSVGVHQASLPSRRIHEFWGGQEIALQDGAFGRGIGEDEEHRIRRTIYEQRRELTRQLPLGNNVMSQCTFYEDYSVIDESIIRGPHVQRNSNQKDLYCWKMSRRTQTITLDCTYCLLTNVWQAKYRKCKDNIWGALFVVVDTYQ